MISTLNADDLDIAPCGFFTFSDGGIIRTINKTLADLLGYQKDELVGDSIERILTVAGRIFYHTHFFPLLKLQGKANEIFFSIKVKNGSTLPVVCNSIRRQAENEYMSHCILIPVEERGKYEKELLTARQIAEEALEKNEQTIAAKKELEERTLELDRQLSKLKQVNDDILQFSKIISHDLQEPIRKISLFADKLTLNSNGEINATSNLAKQRVTAECLRLRELVMNLEKYIVLNATLENIISVDLNELIRISFEKAINTSIHVKFTCSGLPTIEGNKEELEMLFYNIFDNTIKYSKRNDPLIKVEGITVQENKFREIRSKYQYRDFLKINISDNGQGIADFTTHDIFQLKKVAGNKLGIGFGLPFCKKIVEKHHGSIRINTSSAGTTVSILLPIAQ